VVRGPRSVQSGVARHAFFLLKYGQNVKCKFSNTSLKSTSLKCYRESRLYGSAIADPIQVNGVQLFRLGNGDCVAFKLPTGQPEVIFVPQWKRLKFVSEKGKKYYFYLRVDAGQSGADFRQLTEDEWNEKQKACNWVELKKEK